MPTALERDREKLKTAFLPYEDGAGIHFSQGFGAEYNPQVYAQFGLLGHNGLDFAMPVGRHVIVVNKGVVVEVVHGDPGYGNFVRYRADSGEVYTYGHLSQTLVFVGQQVTQGFVLGLSGNTGFSTGPHLHFSVKPPQPNQNNGYKGSVNPIPYLQAIYSTPMNDIDQLNGWAVVQNPGGARAFVKGGKRHAFSGTFTNDIQHYLFIKNAKFIAAALYNSIPMGTLNAEQVLQGQKDW